MEEKTERNRKKERMGKEYVLKEQTDDNYRT